MCKSTQVPIEAEKAEVRIDEDNSTSFLNIHVPSMTYVGGFVMLVLVFVALWRFWLHVKERRMRKLQLREMELSSISRSVHDKQDTGVRRLVTAEGEELTVKVMPSGLKGAVRSIEGPAQF